jgi:hypothetical protein
MEKDETTYVEVSGPGSGKTTRLVEAATAYLLKNKFRRAAFVSYRESFALRSRMLLAPDLRNRVEVSETLMPEFVANSLRAFVDDFDLLAKDAVPYYYTNAYYVTTPERVRRLGRDEHDLLLRMASEAGENFHTYSYRGDWRPMKRLLSPAEFDLKIKLNWLLDVSGKPVELL